MADILLALPSPASPAAPSPAWPRSRICEGVGGFYTFVGIDCVIYCFGILSLSENACYTFALSRNGILLWLAPYSNVHDRDLNNNAITSVPSGAFTGLTALNALWGWGSVIPLWGSIVLSTVLQCLYCLRKSVLDFYALAIFFIILTPSLLI